MIYLEDQRSRPYWVRMITTATRYKRKEYLSFFLDNPYSDVRQIYHNDPWFAAAAATIESMDLEYFKMICEKDPVFTIEKVLKFFECALERDREDFLAHLVKKYEEHHLQILNAAISNMSSKCVVYLGRILIENGHESEVLSMFDCFIGNSINNSQDVVFRQLLIWKNTNLWEEEFLRSDRAILKRLLQGGDIVLLKVVLRHGALLPIDLHSRNRAERLLLSQESVSDLVDYILQK